MVTFSPEVPYSEALRVGDEQKAVMDRIMQRPDIEQNWNEQSVMDQLYELATETFGERR
jgi:kynurenine 3-monooxygenase